MGREGTDSVDFASFATLRTCRSFRGVLRSHSSTLIVCFFRGTGPTGARAGEAGRFEIDKDEGICPRRPELEFPLMFDARLLIEVKNY